MSDQPEPASDDLQNRIKEDQARRVGLVSEGINALCQQHNCRIEPIVIISGGQIQSDVLVKAN